jgi:hypothetical protein
MASATSPFNASSHWSQAALVKKIAPTTKIQLRRCALESGAGTDCGQVEPTPPIVKSADPIANRIAIHQASRFGAQK